MVVSERRKREIYAAKELFAFRPPDADEYELGVRRGFLDMLRVLEDGFDLKLCFLDFGFADEIYVFFVDTKTGDILIPDYHGRVGEYLYPYLTTLRRGNYEIVGFNPGASPSHAYWEVIYDILTSFMMDIQQGTTVSDCNGNVVRDIPSFSNAAELKMKLELAGK